MDTLATISQEVKSSGGHGEDVLFLFVVISELCPSSSPAYFSVFGCMGIVGCGPLFFRIEFEEGKSCIFRFHFSPLNILTKTFSPLCRHICNICALCEQDRGEEKIMKGK